MITPARGYVWCCCSNRDDAGVPAEVRSRNPGVRIRVVSPHPAQMWAVRLRVLPCWRSGLVSLCSPVGADFGQRIFSDWNSQRGQLLQTLPATGNTGFFVADELGIHLQLAERAIA